jgi:hypothetical protein
MEDGDDTHAVTNFAVDHHLQRLGKGKDADF